MAVLGKNAVCQKPQSQTPINGGRSSAAFLPSSYLNKSGNRNGRAVTKAATGETIRADQVQPNILGHQILIEIWEVNPTTVEIW
jgi:hypothetical protein